MWLPQQRKCCVVRTQAGRWVKAMGRHAAPKRERLGLCAPLSSRPFARPRRASVWTPPPQSHKPFAMDIRHITPHFFAAPQISPDDMQEIITAGIKRIICNRPDLEVPPSHQSAAIAEAAEAAGIEFFVQPLTHQNMTPEVIAANRALIDECDGPVLAYCASGTRSTIAWALSAAKDTPIDDILAAARAGGYDLGNLRPTLEAAARI